jgi:quinolinate synthase
MQQIDLPHLAWLLDSLAEGRIVNQVHVAQQTAEEARVALRRMIEIKAVQELTSSQPTD